MERELYIGVDVSKNWLDLAYYDGVVVDWKHGHIRVDNKESGYIQIDRWLKKLGVNRERVLFCMEHTGLYCQDFRLWLERNGYVYGMVQPRKMHRFEPDLGENERALDRIKTDEMDSFRIAMYCEKHCRKIRASPSRLPGEAYFRLKRLMAERKQYTRQSVLYKQHLHDISVYDTEGSRERKKAGLGLLTEQIRQTDAEIQRIIESDPALSRNYGLLCSIKGVGLVVAVETIVLTENFTSITNPRKYACYIGIAPAKKESGVSVRGGEHVSRKGFTQAKADLSMICLVAIRLDPGIRAYWQRKKAEGKHSGIVLNAVKFKLVLRMFAVIRRQKPYVEIEGYRKGRAATDGCEQVAL
jgi:transposase